MEGGQTLKVTVSVVDSVLGLFLYRSPFFSGRGAICVPPRRRPG
jgi:hypothetical protein